jgi:serine/threonine-protein kinase
MADDNTFDKTIISSDSFPVLDPRFKILKRIGSGGMGDVYLAEDSKLHRRVALKSIRADLCRNKEIRKRIERECLLHARVGAHPHIVTLFDKLENGDDINLVMEYVEGESLQEVFRESVRNGGEFSRNDALSIAAQVLDALSRIHAQGVVHRDIKPDNVMLTRDDSGTYQAKLMDFGIARLQDDEQATALTAAEGSGPGTPIYMAPEQIDPQTYGHVSPATDIYAVGVMLYHLLTGAPPFKGTLTEIFRGHLTGVPAAFNSRSAESLPQPIADALRRALAKEPVDRYPSAKAFREELLRLASSQTNTDEKTFPAATCDATIVSTPKTYVAAEKPVEHVPDFKNKSGGGRAFMLVIAVAIIVAIIAAAAWFMLGSSAPPTPKQSPSKKQNIPPVDSTLPSVPQTPKANETVYPKQVQETPSTPQSQKQETSIDNRETSRPLETTQKPDAGKSSGAFVDETQEAKPSQKKPESVESVNKAQQEDYQSQSKQEVKASAKTKNETAQKKKSISESETQQKPESSTAPSTGANSGDWLNDVHPVQTTTQKKN